MNINWNLNQTMRMLGNSRLYWELTPGRRFSKEYEEFLHEAMFHMTQQEIIINGIQLGMILGQRMERERRKHEGDTPLTEEQ